MSDCCRKKRSIDWILERNLPGHVSTNESHLFIFLSQSQNTPLRQSILMVNTWALLRFICLLNHNVDLYRLHYTKTWLRKFTWRILSRHQNHKFIDTVFVGVFWFYCRDVVYVVKKIAKLNWPIIKDAFCEDIVILCERIHIIEFHEMFFVVVVVVQFVDEIIIMTNKC